MGKKMKGKKHDKGKNRLGLVWSGFINALEEVGRVGTFGAEKYGAGNWQHVKNGQERYTDAMLRHWTEIEKGNKFDKETKLLHLSHMAWNALAILELEKKKERLK